MNKNTLALIGLGANLPSHDVRADMALLMAIAILHESSRTAMTAISRFWKTPAIPIGSGPDFVNAALALRTDMSAGELLDLLHRTEARFGRDRSTGRWSARSLDLDLIAFGEMVLPDPDTQRRWVNLPVDRQVIDTPDTIILPHPRMQDRGFVLFPLAEIAPGWCHPVTGQSLAQMQAALPPSAIQGIKPFSWQNSAASS